MRINSRPSAFAFLSALLLAVTGLSAQVRAQGSTHLFDSPWLGFDTGSFAVGFEPEGFAPVAVKSADLDHDGDVDLVVGNSGSTKPGLSVLMNAGDGTYSQPTFYYLPEDKSVADIALADVDKDGHLDVLATAPDYNGLSNILAFWRNHGNGTFAPYALFATGPGPKGLTVADFNGDGFPDVATANHGSVSRANNTFSIVLHNGKTGASAGFLAQKEFTVEGMDAQRVAAADVNGDGRADLAVAGKDTVVVPGQFAPTWGKIAVLFNDGAGGFNLSASYVSYPNSRLPSVAVALADLDHDGDADLIAGGMVTNNTDDRGVISIRRNAGNGTFGTAAGYITESNVSTPHSLSVGDLNKDGYPDVVATSPSGRTMDGWFAVLSDGAGGFKPAPRYYEASQMTYDAALFDADRDGDVDVVTVAQAAASATVHRNAGDGTFPVLPRIRLGQVQNDLIGNSFSALEAGDLDRDGDPDLVTADAKAWIVRNNGDGTFAEAALYTPPINPGEIKLRDLNGDGHLDLLFGPDRNAAPYHFGSSLNRGDGTFEAGTVTNVNACQAGSIDAADFDGDGDLDVVLNEEGACVGSGGGIYIFRNNGRGVFTFATYLDPACLPRGLGIGDFNGDGRLDFLTTTCQGVGVFPGKGDLTFGPPIESDPKPYRFKVSDLNGDGRLDLAMILSTYPASTTVVGTSLGNGDGTFAAPQTQRGSSGGSDLILSNDIDTADADGDGDLDVLVANNAPNDLSLFSNEGGTGTLRRHERYGVGAAVMHAAPADYNMDGAVDVASGISLPPYGGLSAVVILRNRRHDLIGEPFVRVTSPANLSTFETPSTVRIAADVQPVPGRSISKVEFYVSGENLQWKLIHTDTTFPYGGFDLTGQTPGFYHVYAVAYDAEGTGISSAVSYWVKNPLRKFTISGKLTDPNGAPLSGAEVAVGGPVAILVTTGPDGSYSVGNLVEGESYSVMPYLDQYEFTPPSQEVNNLSANQTVNFIGRKVSYTISGRLTTGGAGLSGATVTLAGTHSGQVTTGVDGSYAFAGLPLGADVSVLPVKDGYRFSPPGASFPAVSANITADFAASPVSAVRFNHALASRGATATASTFLDPTRAPLAAINGERAGLNWGRDAANGSGWHDSSNNTYPDWLEINFGGTKSVDEVNVFSVQDNVSSPSSPTEAQTFTKYGVTDFTVEYWDGAAGAWVPVPGGMVNGNNKVWRKLTFAAVSTSKMRVVVTGALAGYSRLTEVEAWGHGVPSALVNHALRTEGARATASTEIDSNRSALAAINGDRRGLHWGSDAATGSGWHDASNNKYPDWLEVEFAGPRTIQRVNVFSVQDNVYSPQEPTETMTFTKYGVNNFRVEYWDGASWLGVPGEEVWGNDKVWRTVTFAPVTTTKIRVVVNLAQAGYSRLTEVEAWGQLAGAPPPPTVPVNHALASNGASVAASTELDSNRSARAAINGDRRALHWGSDPATGSGWHDRTGNSFPDWLEVTFNGAKTISEVNVFSVQDNLAAPQEPTESQTFSKYGLTDFDVEFWDGAAWQIVPGGMVNGNNKVWRKLTFAPITTTKIRVVARGGLAGYSRLAEVEAY